MNIISANELRPHLPGETRKLRCGLINTIIGEVKMGLERFKRFTSTDKGFVPNVSIWNKGQFWFSSGAVNKFNLERYSHVVFLYDKEAREIGLLFRGNDKEEGTVKLGKRQTGIVVGAKNFLDCFNIDYSQTKQYLMRVEQEPDLFVISLDQGKVSEKNRNTGGEDGQDAD
jgi:hypothetical protein